jgi:hypothetical protein
MKLVRGFHPAQNLSGFSTIETCNIDAAPLLFAGFPNGWRRIFALEIANPLN